MTDHTRHAGFAGPFVAAGLLLVSESASAFSSGPPNGRTNAPGEGVCTECHASFALNSGGGTFAVTGAPTQYAPNTAYTITVTINQTGQSRWGFELVALTASGQQAGTITVTDAANTQTSVSNGKTYIKHSSAGTRSGQPGPTSWSFVWTSPATDLGVITFYAAGNAADNDGSHDGDRIYTTTAQSGPPPTGIHEVAGGVPTRIELAQNRPNPFNPETAIPFALPHRATVRIAVYAITGQAVKTLAAGTFAPGRYVVAWDGTDESGHYVASGVYIVVLEAPGVVQSRTILLAR